MRHASKKGEVVYCEFGETLKGKLRCDAYDLDADRPTLFSAKVMDRVIQVNTLDCFIYRPMQIRVHAEVMQPMSQ